MPGFSGCLQLPGKPRGSCMSWGSVGFSSGSQVTFPFWRSLFLLYLLGEPHGWSHFTSQALSRWFLYSSIELLFQPEGKWSPRRPSTHIIGYPNLLLWLDAEPPPGNHMVDCVHSAPYWRFPISQGFGQLGIQGGKSLVLLLYHPFSRY